MKKLVLAIGLALMVTTLTFGQKNKLSSTDRPLTPARGHYQQLKSFDEKPKVHAGEIDQLKFPYDSAVAKRRLSLKPYYLVDVAPDEFKIPNPPANSSDQTKAELNYLLGLQQYRSEEDVRSSLHMAGVYYNLRVKPTDSTYGQYRRNLFQIGRSIGNWFNPEHLPVTTDVMARVWQDASFFIWSLKYKYARVRPYVLEKDLENLEETDWAAYPSGHAANSYVNAFLYQELAPEFTDVLIKDAYDMAHSREIIGVHYPSDSEASRIFARQFVNRLLSNKKFLGDFELMKNEWKEKAKETFSKPEESLKQGAVKSSCAKKCE